MENETKNLWKTLIDNGFFNSLAVLLIGIFVLVYLLIL